MLSRNSSLILSAIFVALLTASSYPVLAQTEQAEGFSKSGETGIPQGYKHKSADFWMKNRQKTTAEEAREKAQQARMDEMRAALAASKEDPTKGEVKPGEIKTETTTKRTTVFASGPTGANQPSDYYVNPKANRKAPYTSDELQNKSGGYTSAGTPSEQKPKPVYRAQAAKPPSAKSMEEATARHQSLLDAARKQAEAVKNLEKSAPAGEPKAAPPAGPKYPPLTSYTHEEITLKEEAPPLKMEQGPEVTKHASVTLKMPPLKMEQGPEVTTHAPVTLKMPPLKMEQGPEVTTHAPVTLKMPSLKMEQGETRHAGPKYPPLTSYTHEEITLKEEAPPLKVEQGETRVEPMPKPRVAQRAQEEVANKSMEPLTMTEEEHVVSIRPAEVTTLPAKKPMAPLTMTEEEHMTIEHSPVELKTPLKVETGPEVVERAPAQDSTDFTAQEEQEMKRSPEMKKLLADMQKRQAAR